MDHVVLSRDGIPDRGESVRLAIGTPAAVLSGIARAAQIGVLVKGGVHLENLARIKAIAFDKTGTLTAGRPSVTAVASFDPAYSENEILRLAATIDANASHPAAVAIVDAAKSRALTLGDSHQATTLAGRGASAVIDGLTRTSLGSFRLNCRQTPAFKHLRKMDRCLRCSPHDGHPLGVIVLADAPRANAHDVIAALHDQGIDHCIMLTGDRKAVAEPVAKLLGIDQIRSDLMPDEKLKIIGELQAQYGDVAMIGDGVNDAPALAAASVGVAMGGAGADVAIETADIALMSDDLMKLPNAIALARFTRRVITQNLTIALGVIAVLAPLAALGYTRLGVAVLFHEGSTVIVVLNALRLLAFRPLDRAADHAFFDTILFSVPFSSR